MLPKRLQHVLLIICLWSIAKGQAYNSKDSWKTACSLTLLEDPDNDGVISQDELVEYLMQECDDRGCQFGEFEDLPLGIQYHFALTTCANNVTDVTDEVTYLESKKGYKKRDQARLLKRRVREGSIRRRLEDYPEDNGLDPDQYTASLWYVTILDSCIPYS